MFVTRISAANERERKPHLSLPLAYQFQLQEQTIPTATQHYRLTDMFDGTHFYMRSGTVKSWHYKSSVSGETWNVTHTQTFPDPTDKSYHQSPGPLRLSLSLTKSHITVCVGPCVTRWETVHVKHVDEPNIRVIIRMYQHRQLRLRSAIENCVLVQEPFMFSVSLYIWRCRVNWRCCDDFRRTAYRKLPNSADMVYDAISYNGTTTFDLYNCTEIKFWTSTHDT